MPADPSNHSLIAILTAVTSPNFCKRDAIIHSCWVALFIALMTVMATPSAQITPPGNFEVTGRTTTSITLAWDRDITVDHSYRLNRKEGESLEEIIIGFSTSRGHTDSGLNPDTEYTYQVRRLDPVRSPGELSDAITVRTRADPAAPAVPVGLRVTGSTSTSITLTWTEPATNGGTLQSYDIARAPIGGAFVPSSVTHVDSTGGPAEFTQSLTGLDPNTEYEFRVRAISDMGTSVAAVLTAITLPAIPVAPTGLEATSNSNSITLEWDPVVAVSPGGKEIVGYRIQRRVVGEMKFPVIVQDTGNTDASYTDGDVLQGIAYEYRVRAIDRNAGGETPGVRSARVIAATRPAAPTDLMVTGSTTAVTGSTTAVAVALSWAASTNPDGSPDTSVIGYQIQRGFDTSGAFTPISVGLGGAGVTTTATEYTDTDMALAHNSIYRYQVRARNAAGFGDFSTTINVRTLPDAPAAPVLNPVTNTGTSSVTLTWNRPNDNGGPLKGFQIQRRAQGEADFSDITRAPTQFGAQLDQADTSYTDEGLSPGTDYSYQISAFNINSTGTAESGPSPAVTATTMEQTGAPAAPVLNPVTNTGTTSITLTWTAPADPGDTALASYSIERQEAGGAFLPLTPNPPLTAASTSYTDEGLSPATDYSYRLRAINQGGLISGPSPAVSAMTMEQTGAPAAPGDLQAITGATRITLTWDTPATNGGMLDTYSIERRIGIGAFEPLTPNPALTGISTSYTDTGLSPSITYSYRVRAINQGNLISAPSTVTAMTTAPRAPDAPVLQVVTGSTTATSIKLRWNVPDDDGGSIIRDYHIQRALGATPAEGDFEPPVIVPASVGTATTDRGLSSGTIYSYRARARSNLGRSLASNTVTATTLPGAPSAPVLDPVAAADIAFDSVTQVHSIALTWTEPNNGGRMITGYEIKRALGTAPADDDFQPVTGDDGATLITTGNGLVVNGTSISYTDNSNALRGGTTYSYQVSARNALGLSAPSKTGTATTVATAPAAPTDLTSTSTSNSITLSWNPSLGATSYEIERAGGSTAPSLGNAVVLGTTTETEYTDPDSNDASTTAAALLVSGSYRYWVRARNAAGFSDRVALSTLTLPEAPDAPGTPTVTATTTSITLTWNRPNDNGGPLEGFQIQRRAQGEADFSDITRAPTRSDAQLDEDDTSYTDEGLSPGTDYSYQIFAFNINGLEIPVLSGSPNVVTKKTMEQTGAPAAPGTPTVTATTTSITLTWTAPATNGGTLASYSIERQEARGAFASVTADPVPVSDLIVNVSPAGTSTSYTDEGLSPATDYSYRLRAINQGGLSSGPSPAVSKKTMEQTGAPAAPGDLQATNIGATRITLTWDTPVDPGNTALDTYSIERRIGIGAFEPLTPNPPLTGTSTSYTDTGLSPSITYSYRVRAINQGNLISAPSTVTAMTTAPRVPDAPVLQVVTGSTTATSIKLRWNVPDDDGGSIIRDYHIQRALGATPAEDDFEPPVIVPASVGTATDRGLSSGTIYSYQVRARSNLGLSLASNTVTATTLPGAPSAPVLDPVEAADIAFDSVTRVHSIALTWTAPNNGGRMITGYEIERALGTAPADDDFQPVTGSDGATLITTGNGLVVNGTSISYTDNSNALRGGTTYSYQVSARNILGDSPASNTGTATTMATAPAAPTDLTSTSTSNSVTLSWNPSLGATSYEIERAGGSTAPSLGNAVVLGTTTETEYTDPDSNDASTTAAALLVSGSYRYWVRARNAAGFSDRVALSTLTLPEAPDAPVLQVVTGSTTATSITLMWDRPNQRSGPLEGYQIQRRAEDEADFSDITPAPTRSGAQLDEDETSYTDEGLSPRTEYRYRIFAFNINGLEIPVLSGSSNVETETTMPATRPNPPTRLGARGNNVGVGLTWFIPSDNGGSPITHYELQRALGATPADTDFVLVTGTPIAVANLTVSGTTMRFASYTDPDPEDPKATSLMLGTTYSYRVSARNAIGLSAPSNTGTATTLAPPGVPENVMAVPVISTEVARIRLSWTAPMNADGTLNDGGSAITGYEIERALGTAPADDDFQPVTLSDGATLITTANGLTVNGTSISYTDNSDALRGDMTYSYRVSARNLIGLSAPAESGTATTPIIVPAAPGSPTAVASTTDLEITLSWTAPDDGGSAITSYNIFRVEGSTDSVDTSVVTPFTTITGADIAGNPIRYTDDMGLSPATTYSYAVTAANVVGAGAPSNTGTATTMALPPGAPTGLTANDMTDVSTRALSIELSWTAPVNADGTPNDGGSAITSYEIERALGTAPADDDFQPVTGSDGVAFITTANGLVVNGTSISYTDNSDALRWGMTYSYRVSARNRIGLSAPAESGTVTAPIIAPAAPGSPTAVASTTDLEITLSWTAPDDGGSMVTGYNIDRAEGATPADDDFQPVTGSDDATPITTANGLMVNVISTGTTTISYTDNSDALRGGVTYTYRLSAINSLFEGAPATTNSVTTLALPTAPAAPTGLTANDMTDVSTRALSIELSWTAPVNADSTTDTSVTSYEIERAEGATPADDDFQPVTGSDGVAFITTANGLVVNGTSISYTDNSDALRGGITYSYQVFARNAPGPTGLSPASNTGTVTTAIVAPAAPTGLTANDMTDVSTRALSIGLSWTAPENADGTPNDGGSAITSYEIERALGTAPADDDFQPVTLSTPLTGASRSYTDNSDALRGGMTYSYRVSARNRIGLSAPAESGTATTAIVAPAAPGSPTAVASTTDLEITLSWTAPENADGTPNDGGSAITSYRIDRQEGGAGDFLPVTTPDPLPVGDAALTLTGTSTISYTDTGLSANTRYSYQVSALNTAAGEGLSATLADDILTRPVAPDRPVLNPVTITGTSSVTLSWPTPNHNNGPLSGYRIERTAGAVDVVFDVPLADIVEVVTGTGTSTTYIDTNGLAPGTTYQYRVLAINTNASGSAESAFSGAVTATTMAAPVTPTPPGAPTAPDAPTGLTASSIGTSSVVLTWTKPDDGSSMITSYRIDRQEDGVGNFLPVTTPDPLPVGNPALTGTSTISYTDTGLSANTRYSYQVSALNTAAGEGLSATLADDILTRPVAPDRPVLNPVTITGTSSVTLSWPTPNHNNGPLSGYRIERTAGAVDVVFDVPLADIVEVVTGTGTSTSYTNTGLTSGTTYQYRVLATNTNDTGSAHSAFSNPPVSATTLAAPAVPTTPVTPTASGSPTALMVENITFDSVNRIHSIMLSWTAPENDDGTTDTSVTDYEIERRVGGGVATLITPSGTATSYTDSGGAFMGGIGGGLRGDVTYEYQVFAINAPGPAGRSAPSNTVTATTSVVAPGMPTELMATASTTALAVELSWTPPMHADNTPDDGGRAITSYNIFRVQGTGTVDTSVVTPIAILTGADIIGNPISYTDDMGLSPATDYSYALVAVNGVGAGEPSAPVIATTVATPPNAPVLDDIEVSDITFDSVNRAHSIGLSWTAPENDDGTTDTSVTSYQIERRTALNGAVMLFTPSGTATSYTDSSDALRGGMRYEYRVFARNASGRSRASNIRIIPIPPVAPAAPTRLMAPEADRNTNSITLTWNQPDDNGGSMITGYEIERQAEGDADFVLITAPPLGPDARSHIDMTVNANTQYSYQVRALNDAGAGAFATLADIFTLPAASGSPTGLMVVADGATVDGSIIVDAVTGDSITFSWTAPVTDPADPEITAYQVERQAEGDADFMLITDPPLSGAARSHTDTGLSPGTTYRYRVRAINTGAGGGMSTSAPSNALEQITDVIAPSGLELTAMFINATEVELSWTLEATGGAAVTYSLARSEDASFTGTTAVTLTPDNTVTSARDSGLEAGTQYYYRVTATNSADSVTSAIVTPTGGLSERAQALNKSLLPTIAQTASAMTLDAISSRIDNVLSGAVANKTTFAGADSSHAIVKQLGSDLSSEQELGDMLLKWLGNSSFSHSFAGSGVAGGSGLSVWGSGRYKDLENDATALSWDGNVWGLSVGADVQLDADWLLGTALSWSSGEFDYIDRTTTSTGDYDYENFAIHPYFNWAPSGQGYNIWGSVSYGSGEIEIRDQAMPEEVSSDTKQYGVAAGMNLTLSSSHSADVSRSIDLKSDVSALWIDIDGSGEDILSDTVQHQRLRLLLSAEHEYIVGTQRHLVPSIELGGRYDTGGSAEDGAGIEFSGSLSYKDLLAGFYLSGRMNALLNADYEEWGASAVLRFGDGGGNRGLSFSLEPTIGRASADPSRLWQQEASSLINTSRGGASNLSAALVSEISYGMGMHSAFSVPATWQPYANMELGSAIRRYRLGLRYQFAQGLGFRIEGQSLRNSGASATDSNTGKDYGVQLKTEFEF